MDVKDNSEIFLKKPYQPFDPVSMQRRPGRRVISPGLGGRRKPFTGVIRGQDVLKPVASDSSGAIHLGTSLPSPAEMVRRERMEEMTDRFLEEAKKHPQKPVDDERRLRRACTAPSLP